MGIGVVRSATWLGLSLFLALAAARPAEAQVEIEKILVRLDGVAITQLDVRRTRLLGLFSEATVDDQVLRELENRHLILNEVNLFPPAEPDPIEVAARRAAWTRRVGASADLPERLRRAGMTDVALDAWFRDDLRVAAYIDLRWGAMPEADRPARIDGWIAELRQRAGLR